MGKAATAPTAKNEYRPDSVSAPGATLADVLEEYEMTQTELAERTGRTPKFVSNLVNGKATLTQETALQLERVLQIPASFWNNREQQYREALARQEETDRCRQFVSWIKESIPVREMIGKGWLPRREDDADQVREVLDFFGVSTPNEWKTVWMNPQKQAAFRKSLTFSSEPGAVSAWLRYGERTAREIDCEPFNKEAFKKALRRIRSLTATAPEVFKPEMRAQCAKAGVALVFTPQVDEARICGATRWLSKDKALIQQSLRYKTDDQFWFTFFHEAGHVLRHGKRDVFLEDTDAGEEEKDKEEEADRFACDFLIPRKSWRAFVATGDFSEAAIRAFADEQGIAPGIVVGRLQHEQHLPWNTRLNHLKRSLRWSDYE